MAFYIKLMRLCGRSNSTLVLTFIVIAFTFIGFHVYHKGKYSYDPNDTYPPTDDKKNAAQISTSKIRTSEGRIFNLRKEF